VYEVISIEILYYIHEWFLQGPKLSIYKIKGELGGLDKCRENYTLERLMHAPSDLISWQVTPSS